MASLSSMLKDFLANLDPDKKLNSLIILNLLPDDIPLSYAHTCDIDMGKTVVE